MTLRAAKRLLRRAAGIPGQDYSGYDVDLAVPKPSDQALHVAKTIRGAQRPAAIIIHGVMPRSGTVYTGELLRLHPALHAYPNDIWEMPFLGLAGEIQNVQKQFFTAYKQNKNKLGNHDFLPLFGASIIAYLYSFVPNGKQMLLKAPNVRYLNFFSSLFPFENLLLLMICEKTEIRSS